MRVAIPCGPATTAALAMTWPRVSLLHLMAVALVAGYTEPGPGAGRPGWSTRHRGETAWTRTYDGTGESEAYSIAAAPDGGYIVADI